MSEHYPRSTESVTLWCNHCGKPTQHKVSEGIAGRCMEHEAPEFSKKQLRERERREKEKQNPGFDFGEGKNG